MKCDQIKLSSKDNSRIVRIERQGHVNVKISYLDSDGNAVEPMDLIGSKDEDLRDRAAENIVDYLVRADVSSDKAKAEADARDALDLVRNT